MLRRSVRIYLIWTSLLVGCTETATTDRCQYQVTTLPSDAATGLGFSAEDAMAFARGIRAGEMTWKAGVTGPGQPTGRTRVSLEVGPVAGLARVFTESTGASACERYLEFDAPLAVKTDDGALNERFPSVVFSAVTVNVIRAAIDIGKLSLTGTLHLPTIKEGQTAILWSQFGIATAGGISIQTATDNGAVKILAGDPLAEWIELK